MKKLLALVLALIMVASVFAGCGDETANNSAGNFVDVEYKVNEEAAKFDDSSEMPDWTGKQLDLKMWYGTGSYSLKRDKVSTDDVVTPEWFRVTGVKFSEESYDNNGELQDAKLAKIIASNDWPAILWGCQNNVLSKLIEEDMIYDLTDLIPKYMPNLNALMEKGDWMKSKREDGKIYEIDLSCPVDYAYPDMDPNVLARTSVPPSDTGYVMVRDDILKQLKPEALTQDELIQIYNENGKFTEEQILNASFNSKEEFYQFLRDVKALNVKAGNREVYATYALAGSDNWDFLTVLSGALNGYNCYPVGIGNNYFTYFDMETGRIEYTFLQDWYKEGVKELVELIQEDVIAQDSLIDNRATYEEKCASGQYAVLYGGTAPDINKLNENSQGYKYRKVVINIPWNQEKFVPMKDKLGGGYKYAFVKSQISEEELPQVLRAFDFMITDVGQKLIQWGPKSAGLFEETENGRRFINKEVEQNAVYGASNDAQLKYGLNNGHWPGYPSGVNRWMPIYVYDFVPNISKMNYAFSTGTFKPIETVQSITPAVYSFGQLVPETSRFWDARTAFETALTKVLTATNDDEFNSLWQTLVDESTRNGLTDETLAQVNDAWVSQLNSLYMNNIVDYMDAHGKKLNIDMK